MMPPRRGRTHDRCRPRAGRCANGKGRPSKSFFFTIITAIVYLIVRGRGMAERSASAAMGARRAQEDYIRSVAGAGGGSGSSATTSPAEQIATATQLLDSGTITQQEFEGLTAKALA